MLGFVLIVRKITTPSCKMASKLVLLMSLAVSIASADHHVPGLTSANTEFGAKVFATIAPKYDNVVLSPYSLHSALTMTSMAAVGQTREQMRNVLGLNSMTDAEVNDAYSKLIMSFDNTGNVDVLTGNAIFQNPKHALGQEFKDLVMSKYHAMAAKLNFSTPGGAEAQINDYVAEKTMDMIKDLLSANTLSEVTTKLVLVNTLFFNGSWSSPFNKMDTKPQDFHISATEKVKVDMMMNEHHYEIKQTQEYQTVRLPFRDNRFALYIVMPNNTDGVVNPKCLPETDADEFFKNLKSDNKIKFYMPKFEINFKQNMPPLLVGMGMKRAFTPDAEFPKISANTMLSDVVHQAVIEVTETGTTAAAATAIVAVLTANFPSNPMEIRADRPFLFYLRDDEKAEILFQGKYSRPVDNPGGLAMPVTRDVPQCGVGDNDNNAGSTPSVAIIGWLGSLAILAIFRLWNMY